MRCDRGRERRRDRVLSAAKTSFTFPARRTPELTGAGGVSSGNAEMENGRIALLQPTQQAVLLEGPRVVASVNCPFATALDRRLRATADDRC
jgi:hypothetical protein